MGGVGPSVPHNSKRDDSKARAAVHREADLKEWSFQFNVSVQASSRPSRRSWRGSATLTFVVIGCVASATPFGQNGGPAHEFALHPKWITLKLNTHTHGGHM